MKKLVVIPIALFILVGSATTAVAHYIYENGYVWENGAGNCVYARSEISHGVANGGYSKVYSQLSKIRNTPWGPIHCNQNWERPVNYFRVQNALWKWNGSTWYECIRTKYKYNLTTSYNMTQAKYWNRPCGIGYYGNYGGGWTNFNGSWVGGWLWSGGTGHYLAP